MTLFLNKIIVRFVYNTILIATCDFVYLFIRESTDLLIHRIRRRVCLNNLEQITMIKFRIRILTL